MSPQEMTSMMESLAGGWQDSGLTQIQYAEINNYFFAGSHDGAMNAAVIYSLLATCKIREVEPYQWLKNLLEIVTDYPANQLEKLLPAGK